VRVESLAGVSGEPRRRRFDGVGAARMSADDGAPGGGGRTWRATRGASTAVGERRETGARDALGARREASSGFGDGVREVRGDRGAGETGAEPHFFLAMAENGPYSHISVARGEEFFDAKVQ